MKLAFPSRSLLAFAQTKRLMPDDNQQPNQPPPAPPNPERKTLDDRAKMTELERIRHSCAHIMATAILRLWPEARAAGRERVFRRWNSDWQGGWPWIIIAERWRVT